jgi:uncharacterized protein (DUF362 family)
MTRSACWAAYAALGTTLPVFTVSGLPQAAPYPDIAVADGNHGPATRASIDALGGIGRFVKAGDRVLIKPNMSFPNPPEMGSTTHPEVVRELAAMCHEAGASSVLVLDNPLRDADLSLERSGLKEACSGLPKVLVQGVTNRRFYSKVRIPEGTSLKSTMVMRQFLEADVLIAAPVAKSHSATGVSLSMKGMMGLIYDRAEFHLDLDLNEAIVDLCTVLRADITVIDASRILSSGGPGGPGKVLTLNKVIASTDMVAADAMAVELGTWYGRKFKASQVKHIRMAHDRKLGNMDIAKQVVKEVTV